MNSVVKFLFYKTYEDRLSKLKIITIIWFILWFVLFAAQGSIIAAFFGGLAMAVPLFSIGLIIRILFLDKENVVPSIEENMVSSVADETVSDVEEESVSTEDSQ